VVRMAAAFRPALQARGVPHSAYLDNGSPFIDAWLLRGCAVLGIRLIHSRPGKPPLTGQYHLSPGIFRGSGLPGDVTGFSWIARRVALIGSGQCALLVFHDRC